MTPPGYSDRINHALAFAAKHHDQQVRRGTRLPYFTQPANVAIILTRYGRDESTIVAGILRDVVADYVQDGYAGAHLTQRVADKFGREVLETLLSVVERRADDAGVDLSAVERRDDLLARMAAADDKARWVLAAVALHGAATLLADLRRTVDASSVWARFAGGRMATQRWYRRLRDRFREIGFAAPIVDELAAVVDALETYAD